MEQLVHNGVMVPPRYEAQGLTVRIRGEAHVLTPAEEERAVAWAKKIGTPYVEDPVFAENFHADFSELLGFKVLPGDVDYSEIYLLVEAERERRKNLSTEEKKLLRDERKAEREANKERYGYAVIDGERCELGNYMVEPSSIFMGRGEHPFRGKWKEGPRHEDVELNLSPDAPRPPGDWKEIHWDSESMWIARWKDKLTDKMKYVWPHDSSPIKQKKEIEKFDKAIELRRNLDRVKRHIAENLSSGDVKRRKTATVCYLIDELKFRVGDEKDEDEEADTVGASSLRAEHLCFNGDGTVTFDFLGKDSVRLTTTARLDEQVIRNLKGFAEKNRDSTLFDEVNSSVVSEFLDEVMKGITAKVFRTCYATEAVKSRLGELPIERETPEYRKKHVATLANLEAAITCNHKRTIPKTWEQSLMKQKERLAARKQKARENLRKYRERIRDATAKYGERMAKYEAKLEEDKAKLEEYRNTLKEKEEAGKSTKGAKKRVQSKRAGVKKTRERIKSTRDKHRERVAKLQERMETRKQKDQEMIEKITLQLEAKELTRDYNLGTSLKSYVDPRVYYEWGREVDYDWRNYYSSTLEKKFSWVDPEPPEQGAQKSR
ncbi:DNA topoisomerase I [Candidatus Bathyarchaeota archaeon]|nr:DNA topoisomerase I [Candidatus Bathyarchaeota archaeon]